ncbi:MAG: MazG nucleotide pyrophosphohydrolase domain-containing protein [Pseudomonadota bacterium]|nr:MazG nucleotide pyrophosphohydrolase domain-containing protein [Pseudomonadota bacterium]
MKKNLLDNIEDTISALDRSEKLQKKAASVGFDWQNSDEIIKKIEEELNEIRDAMTSDKAQDNLSEEIGDLIFSCINLARYYQINSEIALQNTNNKFIKRFNYIEANLRKKNISISDTSLEEMDRLWEESKVNII